MNSASSIDIPVGLGERAYSVTVSDTGLDNAGKTLKPLLHRPWTVIVTDENVAKVQSARFQAGLSKDGIDFQTIVLPAGEATKSIGQLETLLSQLLDLGVERSDLIIALGGGVIGDLVGFAAGILRRGCRFAQVPTSLLAQVDSSVGGKTGVNVAQGKNLIGVFNQPAIVLADVSTLDTLPDRELKAGYAEVVKYAAIDDAAFFDWLERNQGALMRRDRTLMMEAVGHCVRAKARIVEQDEREHGVRALLNLGHTFGHALETAFGYDGRLLHGEAVAAGMALAFDYSVSQGTCPADDAARLKKHLRAAGLPAGLGDIDGANEHSAARLMAHMRQDKKVSGGNLTLILADGLGASKIVRHVDQQSVERFWVENGAPA